MREASDMQIGSTALLLATATVVFGLYQSRDHHGPLRARPTTPRASLQTGAWALGKQGLQPSHLLIDL
ncbi:hypothetical protein GUJ93_ZPchr0001g30317 [Zizania palustris]|uniref:Uncharacterized protein n=1 Tax=Zizania palustris TaxID=103762 RepID=A0A8J5RTK9_ZIZPA|nr:hypothetical protein GUJ93_ZPchr0001g30317 [Zizania palustris]